MVRRRLGGHGRWWIIIVGVVRGCGLLSLAWDIIDVSITRDMILRTVGFGLDCPHSILSRTGMRLRMLLLPWKLVMTVLHSSIHFLPQSPSLSPPPSSLHCPSSLSWMDKLYHVSFLSGVLMRWQGAMSGINIKWPLR